MRAPKRAFLLSLLALVGVAVGFGTWKAFLSSSRPFPRREADYYMNDPVLGHRHRPHVRRELAWPEHTLRRVVMATNNLGMRSDRDVEIAKPPGVCRTLAVGDSHLDGVVYNSECFATVLESLIHHPSHSQRAEVLNVATGYYGPDQYLASLEAYRDLGPDHVLVGFYTGNDLLDAARLAEARRGGALERPKDYKSKLRQAARKHDGAVAQLLNQTYYFKTFPEMKALVLDRVEDVFVQMQQLASVSRVSLAIILIPTKWDVDPKPLASEFAEAAGLLELDEGDLRMASELRAELGERLRRRGVRHWDPTDEMRQSPIPLFWNQDFHLNVAGHRRLAEIVARAYQP